MLVSSSADSQTEPHELSSQAAMDLTSALASTDTLSDSGVAPAEPAEPAAPSPLVTESTDPPGSLCESSNSPSPPMPLPVESPEPPAEPSVPAEDPLCPAPVDLLQSPAVDESTADDSPAQAIEDTTVPVEEPAEPLEEPAEPLDMAPAHHCSHESDEEEPEEEAALE